MPSKRFSRQFRKFRKPLPERNRARAKQSLCSNCKTPTPRYSPGTPRACRERPFSYHGNPRIDRWSHRSIARLCRASLMTRLDREKKNTSTFASEKRLRTPTRTPPPTTTPASSTVHLRRDPTISAHHRMTKRSTRFAERVVAPATIEARVKENGRVSSSRDRKPRRLGGRRNRRGHLYVSIAPIG